MIPAKEKSLPGSLRTGLLLPAAARLLLCCAQTGEPDAIDVGDAGDPPRSDAGSPPDLDAGGNAIPCTLTTSEQSGQSGQLCVAGVPIDEVIQLTSVWGSSATDVWAVGALGTILHYDGAVWEKLDRAIAGGAYGTTYHTIKNVWLERADDVWIADGHYIRHSTGWNGPNTEWSFAYERNPPRYGSAPAAFSGKGNSIWLVGGHHPHFLERFDGWADGLIARQSFEPPSISMSVAVTMSRSDEVWVVGSRNHTGWTTDPSQLVGSVFRASLSTGDGGAQDPPRWHVEEYDGLTTRLLYGVWGDESNIWLVGEGGTLRRMTRSAVASKRFEIVPSPVSTTLYAIFGFGPDNVWAVGEASTVVHWDGASWIKLSTPFDGASDKPTFHGVWGSSPADVWIAGEGTMLHFQGVNAP